MPHLPDRTPASPTVLLGDQTHWSTPRARALLLLTHHGFVDRLAIRVCATYMCDVICCLCESPISTRTLLCRQSIKTMTYPQNFCPHRPTRFRSVDSMRDALQRHVPRQSQNCSLSGPRSSMMRNCAQQHSVSVRDCSQRHPVSVSDCSQRRVLDLDFSDAFTRQTQVRFLTHPSFWNI